MKRAEGKKRRIGDVSVGTTSLSLTLQRIDKMGRYLILPMGLWTLPILSGFWNQLPHRPICLKCPASLSRLRYLKPPVDTPVGADFAHQVNLTVLLLPSSGGQPAKRPMEGMGSHGVNAPPPRCGCLKPNSIFPFSLSTHILLPGCRI